MDTQPESPIISYESAPNQSPLPEPPGRSLQVPKKLLLIIGIVILLVLVGGAVLLRSKSTNTKQAAVPQDILLASVGNQKIYKSDVITAAGEQYAASAITPEVLKKFYPIVIERAILDQEAKKLSITITDADVSKALPNTTFVNNVQRTDVRYQLIKNNIIASQVTSVQAYLIGYWIPPLSYQQIPLFDQQRQVGKQALTEGKAMLQNGLQPVVVVKKLYQNYPLLKDILSINGMFVSKLKDESLVSKPLTLTKGQTDIDKSIFALQKGAIVIVDGENGAGASLVQIIAVNSGDFTNYDAWLAHQKQTQVKVVNQL